MRTGCGCIQLCLLKLCAKLLCMFFFFVYNFLSGKKEESAALEPPALPDHFPFGVQIKNSLHSTVAAAWRGFNCWLMQDLWRRAATPAGSFRTWRWSGGVHAQFTASEYFLIWKLKFCIFLIPQTRRMLPALQHPLKDVCQTIQNTRAKTPNDAHSFFSQTEMGGILKAVRLTRHASRLKASYVQCLRKPTGLSITTASLGRCIVSVGGQTDMKEKVRKQPSGAI